MCPYAIMVREQYTHFLSYQFKFIENDKIEEGTLLNSTNNNLDPFLYHLGKCGLDSFKKLERSQIHCCWPHDDEEDQDVELVVEGDVLVEEDEGLIETNYCNGNYEVVKIFNRKGVIYYGRDNVYAFRQGGHQCICEQCHQNKGDIDIMKCVVCRT